MMERNIFRMPRRHQRAQCRSLGLFSVFFFLFASWVEVQASSALVGAFIWVCLQFPTQTNHSRVCLRAQLASLPHTALPFRCYTVIEFNHLWPVWVFAFVGDIPWTYSVTSHQQADRPLPRPLLTTLMWDVELNCWGSVGNYWHLTQKKTQIGAFFLFFFQSVCSCTFIVETKAYCVWWCHNLLLGKGVVDNRGRQKMCIV